MGDHERYDQHRVHGGGVPIGEGRGEEAVDGMAERLGVVEEGPRMVGLPGVESDQGEGAGGHEAGGEAHGAGGGARRIPRPPAR